jgi:hypothetical protein
MILVHNFSVKKDECNKKFDNFFCHVRNNIGFSSGGKACNIKIRFVSQMLQNSPLRRST